MSWTAFWRGVASIFDLSGSGYDPERPLRPNDRQAFTRDSEAIARDVRRALGQPVAAGPDEGLEQKKYTALYAKLVKRCVMLGRVPPDPRDSNAARALLDELRKEDR